MDILSPTLGAKLRYLTALLDDAVGAAYKDAGLNYKPRYTPIMKALMREDGLTVGRLAALGQVSQPAATQSVRQMSNAGLVSVRKGDDERERRVFLTAKARRLAPRLLNHWSATNAAAKALERELSAPLTAIIDEALAALERKSFAARIAAARKKKERA